VNVRKLVPLLFFLLAVPGHTEITELRIPMGAGGVGFLPLLVMQKNRLIEKYAPGVKVRWINIGGPAVMNDALLSGSADFITAGPPAFITLWDRTTSSVKIKGVAAMSSMPMYLNTRTDRLQKLDDLTEKDKIAVTSIKVSIPSIVMQMVAAQKYGLPQAFRYDRYTVTMTHPDAVIALLAGSNAVDAHFSSPPFAQREKKDPRVRTILLSDDVMGGSTTFTMVSTTTKFREQNPKVYAAFLKALQEANAMIAADRKSAAELLGFSVQETVDVLSDPHVKFTTTPENVMKYADFMHRIGSIKNQPTSWKDLFFPEIHSAPGS
jgi:NitT/TauT family transport system substrate-binding protein